MILNDFIAFHSHMPPLRLRLRFFCHAHWRVFAHPVSPHSVERGNLFPGAVAATQNVSWGAVRARHLPRSATPTAVGLPSHSTMESPAPLNMSASKRPICAAGRGSTAFALHQSRYA